MEEGSSVEVLKRRLQPCVVVCNNYHDVSCRHSYYYYCYCIIIVVIIIMSTTTIITAAAAAATMTTTSGLVLVQPVN